RKVTGVKRLKSYTVDASINTTLCSESPHLTSESKSHSVFPRNRFAAADVSACVETRRAISWLAARGAHCARDCRSSLDFLAYCCRIHRRFGMVPSPVPPDNWTAKNDGTCRARPFPSCRKSWCRCPDLASQQ